MDTEALYDANSVSWRRTEPNSISDFTGRPPVFELCGPVQGQRILDLGCGEGYCARELASRGAGSILGIDLSGSMIEIAKKQESEFRQGIRFEQGDIVSLDLPDDSFDLALGVFVFSYLKIEDMVAAFKEVRRVLAVGGRFVFSVPHPSLPFFRRAEPPFFFERNGSGYFSGRNERWEGRIDCVDGRSLPVQMIHKTFEDFFEALAEAGFEGLPTVRELRTQESHGKDHPDLFLPLADTPLHLAIRIEV